MAQMEQQGGAVQQYLSSNERVVDSFQSKPVVEGQEPPLYVLTSERLLELRHGQNSDNRDQVTLKATPIDRVRKLKIKRVSGGADHDEETLIAGGIAMIAAFFLAILPVPGEIRGIMLGAAGLFAIVGIILLVEGYGNNEDGEITIDLTFEQSSKRVSLPVEAEEFAQSVSKRLGQSN